MKEPKPNKPLLALWKVITPDLRRQLAKLARTSSGSLRQYAEGRRATTPALAIRLEKAVTELGFKTIWRTQLNDTCGKCEFAKACLTRKGVRDADTPDEC
jgi:MoaA/NifB/PqqE/SkfB family radical SAM enzyme